jgi:hypothetical protein
MSHSPASASGDQPPAGPGLSAQNLSAQNLTAEGLGARELTARLAADGELTAEDIAALARLDDGPRASWDSWDDDAAAGRDAEPPERWSPLPEGECAGEGSAQWLPLPEGEGEGSAQWLPLPEGEGEPTAAWLAADDEHALPDADTSTPRGAEALDAGFTRKYADPGATGFAGGGPLDVMLPGPDLAWHAAAARRRGLGTLSDNELCGVLGAARKLGSWAGELETAAITELDARRTGAGGRPGEHVAEEVAAVLTLTPRSADNLLGLTHNLARLPQTRALLAAGIIDQDRAKVIANALSVLDAAGALAVENRVTPKAADMTTGELRAACERAIKAHDPQAASRRREQAQKDARVECWPEAAGTSAIAGRDLAPAGVIAADKTLDADARWLHAHGMPGSHDQRRAAAFLARLTNRPLIALLPAADAAPATRFPTAPPPGTTIPGSAPGTASTPGSAPGTATAAGNAAVGTTSAATAGWAGWLGGTVNLTMPASAWLGLSDAPGEAGGPGALDADACRDLASVLAGNRATSWCVTIVDRQGRPTAHGCARDGPGPPGGTDPVAWLTTVKITPIETGTCSHRRESAGYQPSNSLRHVIKVRSPRCGFPGCRRPAVRCDDDHTIPYDKGGRTCECNLHPLCRRHHQAKQAPGWRLDQPEPGKLIWTLPSGRTFGRTTEPYPV